MYIQNLILRLTFTALTNVTVSEKNILSDIPEVQLFSLLIIRTFGKEKTLLFCFEHLGIEGCNFYHDLADREKFAYIINNF